MNPAIYLRFARTDSAFVKTAKTAIYTRLACADDEEIAEQERKLIKYAEDSGYGQCVFAQVF